MAKKTKTKVETENQTERRTGHETTHQVERKTDYEKVLEAEVRALKAEVQVLKAKHHSVDLSCDYVVLDGKKHKIKLVAAAKEMIEQIKKRYVIDDATVIAIDRSGA